MPDLLPRLVSGAAPFALLMATTMLAGQQFDDRSGKSTGSREERVRVLTGLSLTDGTGGPVRSGMTITVVGSMIAAITSHTPADLPANAEIVDLSGRYCTPGLMDVHTHLATAPSRDGYMQDVTATLRELLGSGITDVRDMGGDGRVMSYLARQTQLHELAGPDIYFAAILAGPRFFADPRAASASRGREVGSTPWAHIVREDTDLDALMEQIKGLGATGVKLYASLDPDLAGKVVEAAVVRGLRVWGHWVIDPQKTSAMAAVEAGVQVVSHAYMLMHDVSASERVSSQRVLAGAGGENLLTTMTARGTILDATLVAADGLRTPPDWVGALACAAHIVRAAHAAGVPVATGSDRGSDGGVPAIHREYSLLVTEAGLTPAEVIEAATRISAMAIGIEARRGTLEVGKEATMLIFDVDPTESVTALATPTYVIKRGVAYSGANLRDSSAAVAVVESFPSK